MIDVFTKYALVKPLKNKKGKPVLNAFIERVNESNRKSSKLWVDQGREFYKKIMQKWLHSNNNLMCSTHNEGKSVIAERFIKTLKTKIYIKNGSYLKKLVDQYNNTCHHYITKGPKFKVNDRVRITKYKIFLVKVTLKIGQEKYSLSTLC